MGSVKGGGGRATVMPVGGDDLPSSMCDEGYYETAEHVGNVKHLETDEIFNAVTMAERENAGDGGGGSHEGDVWVVTLATEGNQSTRAVVKVHHGHRKSEALGEAVGYRVCRALGLVRCPAVGWRHLGANESGVPSRLRDHWVSVAALIPDASEPLSRAHMLARPFGNALSLAAFILGQHDDSVSNFLLDASAAPFLIDLDSVMDPMVWTLGERPWLGYAPFRDLDATLVGWSTAPLPRADARHVILHSDSKPAFASVGVNVTSFSHAVSHMAAERHALVASSVAVVPAWLGGLWAQKVKWNHPPPVLDATRYSPEATAMYCRLRGLKLPGPDDLFAGLPVDAVHPDYLPGVEARLHTVRTALERLVHADACV